MSSSRTLTATCLCHTSHLSFKSHLPLPTHFCHCTVCRYTHGTLFSVHAPIPPPTFNPTTFTEYRTSSTCTKWFCATCGSHMLDRVDEGKKGVRWQVGVGVVDGGMEGEERYGKVAEKQEGEGEKWYVGVGVVDSLEWLKSFTFTQHIFVDSTGDGGLTTCLSRMYGKNLPMWKEYPVEGVQGGDLSPSDCEKKEEGVEGGTGDDEEEEEDAKVRAACHCASISFTIKKGSAEGKFKGKHCACTSCRLSTSTPISSWFRVPSTSITSSDPTHSLHSIPSLRTYTSSPGTSRSFCAICGASVAVEYASEPGVVCVVAGLVRARKCRLEGVVEWDGEVGGMEDWRGWVGFRDVVAGRG